MNTANQATEDKSALSKRFYPVPEFINYDAIGSSESKPSVLGKKKQNNQQQVAYYSSLFIYKK